MRARSLLTLLTILAMTTAALPAASAQDDIFSFCNSMWCNILILIVMIVIAVVSNLMKKRKEHEARQKAEAARYGAQAGYFAPPTATGAGFGAPSPYSTQPYTPPNATTFTDAEQDYRTSPIIQVSAPRSYRRAQTSPGVCPRCGSTQIQNYGSGEHKCLNCKKIYYGGRD